MVKGIWLTKIAMYISTKVIFSLSSLWSHGDSKYNRQVYTFHDILTLYLRQRTFKNKCSRRDSDFYCGWTNGGDLNGREGPLKLLTAVLDSQQLLGNQHFPNPSRSHPALPGTNTFFWSNIQDYLVCEHLLVVTFCRAYLDEYLLQYLKLNLWFSPNRESREGWRMTYWPPSVVMVMRVAACANKKDPLVSQEDTSPPTNLN